MNRLVHHLKEVSNGSAYLHSKQALFVAIGAGGKKEGVYIRDHDLAHRVGVSITLNKYGLARSAKFTP